MKLIERRFAVQPPPVVLRSRLPAGPISDANLLRAWRYLTDAHLLKLSGSPEAERVMRLRAAVQP